MTGNRRDAVRSEMARAYALIHDEQRYEAAVDACQRIYAQLLAVGEASAFLLWQLAIAHDYLGNAAEALAFVEEAEAIDPLAPGPMKSRQVILARLREALADEGRADDAATPLRYRLLAERGEADVASHLAMARYQLATGAVAEALRLLEAVTTLHPGHAAAWELYRKASVSAPMSQAQERVQP